MVQLMLDGKDYGSALLAIHEGRMLVKEIQQFLDRRNDESKFTGKPLPNYGSLVTGPDFVSAHFGPGGGSAALINGKLSIILPSSSRR
jgi:hypothetical protein